MIEDYEPLHDIVAEQRRELEALRARVAELEAILKGMRYEGPSLPRVGFMPAEQWLPSASDQESSGG